MVQGSDVKRMKTKENESFFSEARKRRGRKVVRICLPSRLFFV